MILLGAGMHDAGYNGCETCIVYGNNNTVATTTVNPFPLILLFALLLGSILCLGDGKNGMRRFFMICVFIMFAFTIYLIGIALNIIS